MIVTSNSVTHEYTIPDLTTVGQVDSNLNVIESVTVYLNSSTTFDHTFDRTTSEPGEESVTETVTESKTVEEFVSYRVSLETSGISNFSSFDDLTEEEVLQWVFDSHPTTKVNHQNQNEASVLEKKDRVLNPLKYKKDSPVTPWRRREDEASSVN